MESISSVELNGTLMLITQSKNDEHYDMSLVLDTLREKNPDVLAIYVRKNTVVCIMIQDPNDENKVQFINVENHLFDPKTMIDVVQRMIQMNDATIHGKITVIDSEGGKVIAEDGKAVSEGEISQALTDMMEVYKNGIS